MVDLCRYRNDVCPVMCSFLEMVQLASFCIYKSMRIISNHVHAWFVEKWLDLNLNCLSARFDNVMFLNNQVTFFEVSACIAEK